jgi:hypothetical protein
MKHRTRRVALAVVVFVAATSCSRVFFVEPLGSLESGIVFEFHKFVDGGRSKHRIREFLVYQEPVSPEIPPIWSLKGSANVHTISYGETPKGLSEAAAAAPLHAGGIYLVIALDKATFNSIPGSATSYFAVTRSGEAHTCLRTECAALAGPTQARTPLSINFEVQHASASKSALHATGRLTRHCS